MKTFLAILAMAAAVPAAHGAVHPSIRLVGAAPATVAGTGFRGHERVVVSVRTGTAVMRGRALSTARGSFVVRFAKPVRRIPCEQLLVTAVGSRGDRAEWKSAPAPCGTTLQP